MNVQHVQRMQQRLTQISEVGTSDIPKAIKLSNNYRYRTSTIGLATLDFRNPANPVAVLLLLLPGFVGVSAVPFKHAVAGGPAVDSVLAVASVPAHHGVSILAGWPYILDCTMRHNVIRPSH